MHPSKSRSDDTVHPNLDQDSVEVVERLFMLLTINEHGAEAAFDQVLGEIDQPAGALLLLIGLCTNFIEEAAEYEGVDELEIIQRVALRFQRGLFGLTTEPEPEEGSLYDQDEDPTFIDDTEDD